MNTDGSISKFREAPGDALTGSRILVVDDEPAWKIALEAFLCDTDNQLYGAETFEEAQRLISEMTFRVVVLDNRLSDSLRHEGLELLKLVKEKTPAAKIIFVTGYGSPGVERDAYRFGADFYLEKPVPIATLLEVMRRMGVAC